MSPGASKIEIERKGHFEKGNWNKQVDCEIDQWRDAELWAMSWI